MRRRPTVVPGGWDADEHPDTRPFPKAFLPPEEWPPWTHRSEADGRENV